MKKWSKNHEKCINCGTTSIEHDAFGLCKKCYKYKYNKKHITKCDICHKINPLSTRRDGKVICKVCFKKYFYRLKLRECSLCHNISRIDKVEDDKLVCNKCYNKFYVKPKLSVCDICKNYRERTLFRDNKATCRYCYRNYIYEKKEQKCDLCENLGIINKIKNNQKICRTCYRNIRRFYYIALNHKRHILENLSKKSINEEDFIKIKERDKVCVYCSSGTNLSFDHIIPISRGGKSEYNNYVLACMKCNISKGNKNVMEWCENKGIEIPEIIKRAVYGTFADISIEPVP